MVESFYLNMNTMVVNSRAANKALVQTAPALCSFGILARHNRFGGGFGAFLPHRARERLHNAGVSALPSIEIWESFNRNLSYGFSGFRLYFLETPVFRGLP